MSDMRVIRGFIGQLKKPVSAEDVEKFNDEHYQHGREITPDGKLILIDYNLKAVSEKLHPEGFVMIGFPPGQAHTFRGDCTQLGHPVGDVKPFIELYYDGCQSQTSQMTLKQFMGEI